MHDSPERTRNTHGKVVSKAIKSHFRIFETDAFRNADLHAGYFCYNCIYWINAGGGKCMLVENEGPDVMGKVSSVIAPHGCCAGYEPNYDKIHDTRTPQEGGRADTEKNREKVTTADVV
jgi:hypothetical protein